jgi:RNA recognition motif. (a.k.a. RRM, RBD, or RNP domain)
MPHLRSEQQFGRANSRKPDQIPRHHDAQDSAKSESLMCYIVNWTSMHRVTEQDIRSELNNQVPTVSPIDFELGFSQVDHPMLLVFKTSSFQLGLKVLSKLMKEGADARASFSYLDSVQGASGSVFKTKNISQLDTNPTSADIFHSSHFHGRKEHNHSSLSLLRSTSVMADNKFKMTDCKRFLIEGNHSFSNLRFNSESMIISQPSRQNGSVGLEQSEELIDWNNQAIYGYRDEIHEGNYLSPQDNSNQKITTEGFEKSKNKRLLEDNIHKMTMTIKNSSLVISKIDKNGFSKFVDQHEIELDEKGRKKKNAGNILYVKGIDKNQANIKQLVHLFECFGEVELGMHHTKSEYALIKFVRPSAAKQCIKELYGKEILGKNLLIHYSEMQELTMKYYANEKEYYVPNQETRANLHSERKLTVLTKYLSIRFMRKQFENNLHETPQFSVADFHFLFPRGDFVEPFTVTTKNNNDLILEFYSVGAAISFVMGNSFKEFTVAVLPDGRYSIRTDQNHAPDSLRNPATQDLHLFVHLSFVSKSKGH